MLLGVWYSSKVWWENCSSLGAKPYFKLFCGNCIVNTVQVSSKVVSYSHQHSDRVGLWWCGGFFFYCHFSSFLHLSLKNEVISLGFLLDLMSVCLQLAAYLHQMVRSVLIVTTVFSWLHRVPCETSCASSQCPETNA